MPCLNGQGSGSGALRIRDPDDVALRTCLADFGNRLIQQKSAGQRLVKDTKPFTRPTQSDELSLSL